jgi:regulator of sirC expression with transglutaminase-like and TPR domain
MKDCDGAIRLNPKNIGAYYIWGLTYREQGMKAEALADFEKFISLTDNPEWIEMARQEIEELSE